MTDYSITVTTPERQIVVETEDGKVIHVATAGQPQIVMQAVGMQGPPGPAVTELDLGTFN